MQVILREAKRFGASPREVKAAIEAGIVESGLRHLGYGDRDSVGVFQQRPSQGWGSASEGVATDARQFFTAARKLNTQGGTAGDLAARVQRPREDLRGKYHARSGEADAILRGRGVGGGRTRPARDSARVPSAPESAGFDATQGSVEALVLDRPRAASASLPGLPSFAAKAPLAGSVPAGVGGGRQRSVSDELMASPLRAQSVAFGGTQSVPNASGVPGAPTTPKAPTRAKGLKPSGGYSGTQGVALGLAKLTGLPVNGEKRTPERNRAVGGAENSDHLTTKTNAYGVDLGGTEAQRKQGAQQIAGSLGIKNFQYGRDYTLTQGNYRIQLITRSHGTGPHVHVGVERVR